MPMARISSAKPNRRKCSMDRACVALACGLNAVETFWSIRIALMPRLPSSFASIRPQGPPPTIKTCVASWRMLPLTRLRASRKIFCLISNRLIGDNRFRNPCAGIMLAGQPQSGSHLRRLLQYSCCERKFGGPETGRQKSPFKRLGACRGLILDHGGSVMSVVKSTRQRHVKKADTRSELREDDDEGAH